MIESNTRCVVCGIETKNSRSLGRHVRLHGLSASEYKKKYGLERRCSKCGASLSKGCKKGDVCKKCYDWTGKSNPFFGKKHSTETVEKIRDKTSIVSLENWKNEDYRRRVILGTSKPRRSGFGKEQSKRVLKWYQENPEQKHLRSERMARTWSEGKIEPSIHSVSESKKEIEMREEIAYALPDSVVEKKTIRIDGKWYRPDVLIDGWVVVEFYGNYWHANPSMYGVDDVVHHGMTAGEIWEIDRRRISELRKRCCVFIVWERAYNDGRFNLDGLVEEIMLLRDDG